MSRKSFSALKGALHLTVYLFNTLFWCAFIFLAAVAKALVPSERWRKWCGAASNIFAENWIWVNNTVCDLMSDTHWKVEGVETLERSEWYLVLANHQSWTDILVLQRIFHRKIPFLKFFIKSQLFWFPILGQAWWALDFPFVKRYPPSVLKKKPHLRGRDMEITRRACEKFKTVPVSIMNFVEGTRFTPEKHKRQSSPYMNLLRAKAGGIAFVLGAMGGQIRKVLDVTIVYPEGPKSFWTYLRGEIREIQVRVQSFPVDEKLMGDYNSDHDFRVSFQRWLNGLWGEKDLFIQETVMARGLKNRTTETPPLHVFSIDRHEWSRTRRKMKVHESGGMHRER